MPRYSSKERQEQEEARHRHEIFEAAIRVFSTKGYHAATMKDIAEAAAFSVGKLYLHFASKEKLYEELIAEYGDGWISSIERAAGRAGSPRERIEAAVRAQFEFFENNFDLVQFFHNETWGMEMRIESQLGKNIYSRYLRYIALLAALFAQGIEAGQFAGATAEELAYKLLGIQNSLIAAESRAPKRRPWTSVAADVLRLFYHSPLPSAGQARKSS